MGRYRVAKSSEVTYRLDEARGVLGELQISISEIAECVDENAVCGLIGLKNDNLYARIEGEVSARRTKC